VEPIRVLLVGKPLLRDLVAAVACAEVEVVGALDSDAELGSAVASSEPDFVIVPLDEGELTEPYLEALEAHPRLRVLALEGDAELGHLWQLHPTRRELGVASPHTLLAALRNPSWRGAHAGS
jgi:hypothetical protein